jgi:riboflavin kinase/FMN adenylyltransferase
LGTFDGVHLGHQAILKKVIHAAHLSDYESVVLTFFPHPRMVLNQETNIKLLNTIDEKKELFQDLGIDNLVIHPFDADFFSLEAVDFVKNILVKQFNVHKIIIGYDHKFGKNRSASITDLIEFGKKYNFEVEQISVQEINEVSVSSTKIRAAILNGTVEMANQYLGYKYHFSGKVVSGKQIGRKINFPTANIKIEESYKLIPQNGVYVVLCHLDKKIVTGMMNIGSNPTLGNFEQTIEVHLFDFNEDLYGKIVKISVLQFIRSEQKFENLEALQAQLQKDKVYSFHYFNSVENIPF